MFKIRIKKQPQKGDQADYSLYNRTGYAPDTKSTTPVGDTLGPVPREEATLEAEGGETVVGDINQDGYLEHFKFRGKRHSEGGVPANIPAGSFIYSDTKKMRIKDKEVLKHFGQTSFKNGGVTPATVAKQYDINKFMAVLRDENSDPIAKRTAQFMLDNNLKKLAELALVQESMKGFPDGIPAIAESVMGPMSGDMGQAPQEMQQARYGGMALPKAQVGQQTGVKPAAGQVVYVGNKPVKVTSVDPATTLDFPYREDYIKLEDGTRLTKDQWDQLQASSFKASITPDARSTQYYNNYTPKPEYKTRAFNDKVKITNGDELQFRNNTYEVLDAYGENTRDYNSSMKYLRDIFDDTKGIVKAKNKNTNEIEYLEGEDLTDLYNIAPEQVVVKNVRSGFERVIPAKQGDKGIKIGLKEGKWYNTESGREVTNFGKESTVSNGSDFLDTGLEDSKKDTIRVKSFAEAAKKFEAGGQFQFEVGGQSELIEYAVGAETTTDPPKGKVFEIDGKIYYGTVENGMKIIRDTTGKVVHTEKVAVAPANNKPIKSINDLPEVAQKYAKWDPAAKTFRIELNDAATYEERNTVTDALEKYGFKNVMQSANSRIKGSAASEYINFYAGLTPQDFERKFVEAQVGKDASDKMDEVGRRKEYFKILGITNVTEEQLKDPKKLYNDNTFIKDYYQKFQAALPKDQFRPILGNDTKFGFEHLKAIRPYPKDPKPSTPESVTPVKTETKTNEVYFDNPKTKETGWWLPDIANFAAALTDDVNNYAPSLQQVKLDNPDYVLLDPSRQVASIKEQEARQQELINNTASGQVARANMLGVAGESGARSADVLANYENQNAQIVNNAYATAANTNNQEAMMNQQLEDQFMVRSATFGQQKDNSERQLKQRKLNAFLQGTVNNFRKKQTEQVLFPQVYIDPITGDASFSRKGKEMFAPDGLYTGTGANMAGSFATAAAQEASLVDDYIKKYNYTRQEALDSARATLGTGSTRNKLMTQESNNPFAGYTNIPTIDPNVK